jgi:hypothetical protein
MLSGSVIGVAYLIFQSVVGVLDDYWAKALQKTATLILILRIMG